MNEPLHIALYTDDPGKGGVANYTHQIAIGLIETGYRVTLIQTKHESAAARELADRGVRHVWIPFDTGVDFARTLTDTATAEQLLGDLQADLLFFSDCCPISNVAAKHVALHRGVPFVTMVHFVAPYLAERFAQCLPIVGKQFAAAREVIAVSTENLQGLRSMFGLAPNRGKVIFPSAKAVYFDTPKDPAKRRALRAQHRIPDDAIVSFTSARIDPIKGHIFQVHAMQHLLAQQPASKLMIVWAGEGDARAQLEAEVRNRKLQGRIRFIGQQSDVMGWLDAADIFTLTSLSEGMPIAIMEAMARELPVVATPVSGIPEELADTGRLLPDPHTNANGVVVELMQHWGELARKRETRIALGRAARARAEQLFRVERMTRAVIDQMQTCINAARAAA